MALRIQIWTLSTIKTPDINTDFYEWEKTQITFELPQKAFYETETWNYFTIFPVQLRHQRI